MKKLFAIFLLIFGCAVSVRADPQSAAGLWRWEQNGKEAWIFVIDRGAVFDRVVVKTFPDVGDQADDASARPLIQNMKRSGLTYGGGTVTLTDRDNRQTYPARMTLSPIGQTLTIRAIGPHAAARNDLPSAILHRLPDTELAKIPHLAERLSSAERENAKQAAMTAAMIEALKKADREKEASELTQDQQARILFERIEAERAVEERSIRDANGGRIPDFGSPGGGGFSRIDPNDVGGPRMTPPPPPSKLSPPTTTPTPSSSSTPAPTPLASSSELPNTPLAPTTIPPRPTPTPSPSPSAANEPEKHAIINPGVGVGGYELNLPRPTQTPLSAPNVPNETVGSKPEPADAPSITKVTVDDTACRERMKKLGVVSSGPCIDVSEIVNDLAKGDYSFNDPKTGYVDEPITIHLVLKTAENQDVKRPDGGIKGRHGHKVWKIRAVARGHSAWRRFRCRSTRPACTYRNHRRSGRLGMEGDAKIWWQKEISSRGRGQHHCRPR